jgi:hypothetical protein
VNLDAMVLAAVLIGAALAEQRLASGILHSCSSRREDRRRRLLDPS